MSLKSTRLNYGQECGVMECTEQIGKYEFHGVNNEAGMTLSRLETRVCWINERDMAKYRKVVPRQQALFDTIAYHASRQEQ